MDTLDAARRSKIMRSVRSKDTLPELALRSALHARGFRYRLHGKGLPGRPDIVLRKWRACIFVNGCFWHRHGCSKTTMPKTNSEFWAAKFEANRLRDRRAIDELWNKKWRVLTIWECGMAGRANFDVSVDFVTRWLLGTETVSEFPATKRQL